MFVIPLPRASKDKARFYFSGDSRASNPRQGHGVTITLLPPGAGPFSPGFCSREVNPHKLSQTVKQTRN